MSPVAEIDCSPCLATNSCGGPDGLDPRTVRWTRPEDRGQRVPMRMAYLDAQTCMFNVWLEEGKVPDAVARCRTILLRKTDKDGIKLTGDDVPELVEVR